MNQENLLKVICFEPDHLSHPNPWVGHLPFAMWLMLEKKPKTFVELGTHTGNSYFSFCQAIRSEKINCNAFAVDTWKGDEHAGSYAEEIFSAVSLYNNQKYKEFSQLLRMTFDEALERFDDCSIDLLHIDGLHTYEAVRHDFETWLPKLSPGAIVIFHDTNVHERDFGVWRLWSELKLKYSSNIELPYSYGLGIIQLNDAPAGMELKWLQSEFSKKAYFIDIFRALGARQLDRFNILELNSAINSCNKKINDLSLDLVNKDKEIQDKDKEIQDILTSKSWRLTAPLRRFRSIW